MMWRRIFINSLCGGIAGTIWFGLAVVLGAVFSESLFGELIIWLHYPVIILDNRIATVLVEMGFRDVHDLALFLLSVSVVHFTVCACGTGVITAVLVSKKSQKVAASNARAGVVQTPQRDANVELGTRWLFYKRVMLNSFAGGFLCSLWISGVLIVLALLPKNGLADGIKEFHRPLTEFAKGMGGYVSSTAAFSYGRDTLLSCAVVFVLLYVIFGCGVGCVTAIYLSIGPKRRPSETDV